MKPINLFILFSFFVSSVLVFSSCSKKETIKDGKARMQIFLTDDPGNYDAVYIDIQDIKVNYSSDTSTGWVSLPGVHRGTYDILQLVNDKDTLLTDAELNTGKIEQIRLILGPNNFVRVNGQDIPLQTPSAQQSGLKLNIHQQIDGGIVYKLLLDFDASRSIVQTGNGKYILKPVIRTTLQAIGGSIKGYVLPNSFPSAVYAIQGTDTIAGTYTSAGNFLLKGLNAGVYNISIVPSDSTYKSQSKPDITVSVNMVTTLDTIRLQH
jgi:hypothetical protein